MANVIVLSKRVNDLTGQIFGRLTVLSFAFIKNKRFAHWLTKCSCGNEIIVRGSRLVSGDTKSCGCLKNEVLLKRITKHGMSYSRIYIIYRNMINRCTKPNDKDYPSYGGRGIKVCDEWLTFEGFYKDVGESYNKHVEEFGKKNTSIDRYPNVNGNYEPNNFRWATVKEQNNNRRSTPKTINLKEHNIYKRRFFVALNFVLRGRYKRTSFTEKYIGLDTHDFFTHIESLWTEGMSWDNYGRGLGKWCIDHIDGCNQFDLSNETERLLCFNFKNLRPRWWKDNASKSKSIGRK